MAEQDERFRWARKLQSMTDYDIYDTLPEQHEWKAKATEYGKGMPNTLFVVDRKFVYRTRAEARAILEEMFGRPTLNAQIEGADVT